MKMLLDRFAESHKIGLEHHLIWMVCVTPDLVVLGCLTPGADTARNSVPLPTNATLPANKLSLRLLMLEAFKETLLWPIQRADNIILSRGNHGRSDAQSANPNNLRRKDVVGGFRLSLNFYALWNGGNRYGDPQVLIQGELYTRFRKKLRKQCQNYQINRQTRRKDISRMCQVNKRKTSYLQSR